VAKSPAGFVSLKSLKQGPPDAAAALAEIRRIYFKTTRQTIDHDMAHAIRVAQEPADGRRPREGDRLHARAGRDAEELGEEESRKVEERGKVEQ
jgi:hypothetical protein